MSNSSGKNSAKPCRRDGQPQSAGTWPPHANMERWTLALSFSALPPDVISVSFVSVSSISPPKLRLRVSESNRMAQVEVTPDVFALLMNQLTNGSATGEWKTLYCLFENSTSPFFLLININISHNCHTFETAKGQCARCVGDIKVGIKTKAI